MKDENDKYIDPERNPAIATDDEPKEKSDDPLETGLPFEMREKINAGDLANRIKVVFPKQNEIYINDGMSLCVQSSGDVEIIKPSEGQQVWDHSPLKDGSPKELATIKKVVDDNEK